MKYRFIALAGVVALVMAVGTYYSRPVLAQVRAALVSDVDNPARNPVRLNFLSSTNDIVDCFNFGYTVPAGKRLVIDDLSAETVTGSSQAAVHVLTILVSPASTGPCGVETPKQRLAAIPFRPPVLQGGALYFVSAHERVQLVVDSGESIGGELRSNNTSTNNTTHRVFLSGHLVTLP